MWGLVGIIKKSFSSKIINSFTSWTIHKTLQHQLETKHISVPSAARRKRSLKEALFSKDQPFAVRIAAIKIPIKTKAETSANSANSDYAVIKN